MKLRVEITVDEVGHLNIAGEAPGLEHVEAVLLRALAWAQRELLAARVLTAARGGVVIAPPSAIPPNGLRP